MSNVSEFFDAIDQHSSSKSSRPLIIPNIHRVARPYKFSYVVGIQGRFDSNYNQYGKLIQKDNIIELVSFTIKLNKYRRNKNIVNELADFIVANRDGLGFSSSLRYDDNYFVVRVTMKDGDYVAIIEAMSDKLSNLANLYETTVHKNICRVISKFLKNYVGKN